MSDSINKTKKVNLGCGKQIIPDTDDVEWINIDIADYGGNVVRDIIRGLPFDDNSIDEIRAHNILEHIHDNDDFIFVMNECWRVLKQEGKLDVQVPYAHTKAMYRDPTHCRLFTEETFDYFCNGNRDWLYGINSGWEISHIDRVRNHNEIIEVIMTKKILIL